MHRTSQVWHMCNKILGVGNISKNANIMLQANLPACGIHSSMRRMCKNESEEPQDESKIDPSRDRSKVIPVEMSIRYLQSSAYKTTYGDEPVWKKFRRNFKGQFAPKKTRKTCIRKNMISTGSPCPICRDEYLVLDYRNVDLVNQFISPHTGEILSYEKTNICQLRHRELLLAVEKARDHGLITFDVPFRGYDYSEYYQPEKSDAKENGC